MAAILGGADVLGTVLELSGEADYIGGLLRAAGGHRAFDAAVEGSARRLSLFGAASGLVAGGLAAGLVKAVGAAARMEQVEIGFKGVLGSAEAARAKIEELQEFAAQTNFSFADAARGTQLLMGMGASAGETIPIMRALGNAMAASGKGADDFNGALLQVAQVISSGKLQGDEMRILAERGVPVKEILDELGTSMGNVGKAGITSEKFIAALIKTMSSGRFAGAMEEQSKTLIGRWTTLQDVTEQLFITMGKPLASPLGQVVKGVTDLTGLINKMPQMPEFLGPAMLVGMVGLGAAAVVSAVKLGKLSTENIRLTNEALKGSGAANTQKTAEDLLAGALGRASLATDGLITRTRLLEQAHLAAARAAGVQAGAAAGIGRGVPTILPGGTAATRTGAGGVPVPTVLPRTAREGLFADDLAREHAKMKAANIKTAPFDTGALAAGHAARAAAAQAAQKTVMGDTAALFAVGAGKAAGAAGMLGKVAKFGTVGGIVAEVAGHLALSQLPDEGAAGGFKRISQGALTGAGIGGMIGNMIVPGAGGLVGAAGGALVGGGLAAAGEQKAKTEETDAKKLLAATEEQNKILAKIAETLERTGKFPVSTDFVPGSLQVPILRALGKAL